MFGERERFSVGGVCVCGGGAQFVVFEGCATGGCVPLEEAVLSHTDPLVLYRHNLVGIADLSNTIHQLAAHSVEDLEHPPTVHR